MLSLPRRAVFLTLLLFASTHVTVAQINEKQGRITSFHGGLNYAPSPPGGEGAVGVRKHPTSWTSRKSADRQLQTQPEDSTQALVGTEPSQSAVIQHIEDVSVVPGSRVAADHPQTPASYAAADLWDFEDQASMSGGDDGGSSGSSDAGEVPPLAPGAEGSVAMCLVVREQHKDIVEWVEHHAALGVSKIYVWDNKSRKPMNTTLMPYIESGLVHYEWFLKYPLDKQRSKSALPQLWAYDVCLREHGHKHQWMAFVDADEFLVIRDGTPDLPALLRDYTDSGALGVFWVVFGSSGQLTAPKNGALGSYYRCEPPDSRGSHHIKSIVQPRYTIEPLGPHTFQYSGDKHLVTERGEVLDGPIAVAGQRSVKRIALHHYCTKSLQEYKRKMRRGRAMYTAARGWNFWAHINAGATDVCTDAWSLGYTNATLPVGAEGGGHPRGREATAHLQRLLDAANQHIRAEKRDSSGIVVADADQGDETQGVAVTGESVPAATVTAAVRGVCRLDALCKRLSNVNSSMAGASFEAVQRLLDNMDAPPGREGVW